MKHAQPVRVGVDWGSVDQELLGRLMDDNARSAKPLTAAEVTREAIVVSALDSAARAEELGMGKDMIVLSGKVSGVQDLIAVYGELARRSDLALHLGLTEAGMGSKGVVASTAALAVLLQQGIGDTIRVSLTPEPGRDSTRQLPVAPEILQSIRLRSFKPRSTSCPGSGPPTRTVLPELARPLQPLRRAPNPSWPWRYPGVEEMTLAVMGCIVNGPGESKHADVGISLPGTGEEPSAPVFIDGRKTTTLRGGNIAEDFVKIIDDYVERRFGKSGDPDEARKSAVAS